MARTYEMLWNCQFCGTKKLLAKTHKHCPNCGGAQDPRWRFFPSDAEKVAVEVTSTLGLTGFARLPEPERQQRDALHTVRREQRGRGNGAAAPGSRARAGGGLPRRNRSRCAS